MTDEYELESSAEDWMRTKDFASRAVLVGTGALIVFVAVSSFWLAALLVGP